MKISASNATWFARSVAVAIALLVGVEGMSTKSYQDTGGVWTICYGYTHDVEKGDTATPQQCWRMLKSEAEATGKAIAPYLPSTLNPNQYAALISFCYNVGVGNCRDSTLFRLINAGKIDEAAQQFQRWKFVKGKDCTVRANNCLGIPKRRMAEQMLFEQPYTIANKVNSK